MMCCYRASTITPSTSRPPGRDPLLWLKLADIAIMSKAWAEEHNVTKAVGLILFPVHLFP
jgi:hypothetical protein